MAILSGDIKLTKSQVMDDVPEGGGSPVSAVIADGVSNAIFPDISELDRAGGRVNLRKTFVSVQTDDTDGYFGANVIVAQPPQDPRVSVTLFTTGNVFDSRADASSRMEAYLGPGSELGVYLLENHITGQRAIQLFGRVGATIPQPGETLVLAYRLGQSDQRVQYVRVTRVTPEERTFTEVVDSRTTDFQAVVTTCELSDALRYDFPGSPPKRLFSRDSTKTATLGTTVTDAANYYGCVPLTVAASIGDRTVTADSIYTQVVPSTQTENAVLDQNPAPTGNITLATAPRVVQIAEAGHSQRIKVKSANRGFNYVSIMTPLPAPGSVIVSYRALGRWYEIRDNGDGTMSGNGGGTVSYTTGSISVTLQALPDVGSNVIFQWGATTAYTNRSGQAGWRAPEHAFQLDHQGVVPGSVEILWTSNSVVKSATDDGAGKFTGDAAGEIDYASGAVYLRPTAMIDSGGEFSIDYEYRTLQEEILTSLVADAGGFVAFSTAQIPVAGTLSIQWATARLLEESSGTTTAGGDTTKASDTKSIASTVTKTWYDPIVNGITAYGEGNLSSPVVATNPPTIDFVPRTTDYVTVNTVRNDSTSSSTYSTSETVVDNTSKVVIHSITDNGTGGFVGSMGTVVYASKSVSLKVLADWTSSSYKSDHENAQDWAAANDSTTTGYNPGQPTSGSTGGSATAKGGTWQTTSNKELFVPNAFVVRYAIGSATPVSASMTYTPPGVAIDLAPYTSDRIVPGSVRFTWMGTTYDDYEGVIYRGRTSSNPGIVSGKIDYRTGIATMSDYVVGTAGFTLNSLWTSKGEWHTAQIYFRTPVSPIKPTGFVFSVLDVGGTQITATADFDGTITGSHCIGKIDYETGVVEMLFGDYVDDADLTDEQKAQWWYNEALVGSTGKIWRPWPVDPTTLRYNAVSFFYLPLDASIVGLDPVRLPQDGRVPIFRPGTFAVIGNSQSIGPITVSNAQVIDCTRVRLSRVRVIGNDGMVVNAGYTADLEAGTVTFTDVSGYSQPVTIEHRVEDMMLVSDAQITGQITFTNPITHDYPEDTSYVASALIAGDMHARVSVLFDQATWANVWQDTVSGSVATGTFNSTVYPITVTNKGALTERWAIQFTNTTTFNVIGEHVGVIASGNTTTECAPINPATGSPYFTINPLGWGSGWAAGNALRFNTVGAFYPVWVVRTILQGPETVPDDNFTLLIRGDVDNP